MVLFWGQEEILSLKRCPNVSRSLSFPLASSREIKRSVEECFLESESDMLEQHDDDDMLDYEFKSIRMFHKQVYLARLC